MRRNGSEIHHEGNSRNLSFFEKIKNLPLPCNVLGPGLFDGYAFLLISQVAFLFSMGSLIQKATTSFVAADTKNILAKILR